MMNGTASSRASVTTASSAHQDLEPPPFRLPEDFHEEPDRYELWSLRIPSSVKLDDLHGKSISVRAGGAGGGSSWRSIPSEEGNQFTSNGTTYAFRAGHAVENELFRVLFPEQKRPHSFSNSSSITRDGSSDGSDSDACSSKDDIQGGSSVANSSRLCPSTRAFSFHVNVVNQSIGQPYAEVKRAMGAASALPLSEPTLLRKPYGPVPQKSALKRRWVPLGGRGEVGKSCATIPAGRNVHTLDPPCRVKASHVNQDGDDEPREQGVILSHCFLYIQHEEQRAKDKEEKKAHKKEAKKANKKEAKKAKKAKKHRKREK